MAKLQQQVKERFDNSYRSLAQKRIYWDQAENIFHGILDDAISQGKKSQNFDSKLPTYLIERSNRVMAQLATGKFRPVSRDDEFSSKLMNLIVDKYVLPNASSQWPFLIKLRMMDRYSNIYGNYFALLDWDIKKNGYMGPDLFLLNIRDVFPQVGVLSLDDSDYIIVRQRQPISYFQNLKKTEYKNINTIIEKLKKKSESERKDRSKREISQYPNVSPLKGDGYYDVLSMYERDRWVDYVPDADDDGVLRDISNQHDNGELPIICKYALPLIDDFFGFSDMERGMPMQKTINSLWNLYLDSVRYSIFPPMIINKDAIVPSTWKWGAAAKWMVRGSPGNAALPVNLSPQGTNTFQAVYNTATASLLNVMGTTDTTTQQSTDISFGKTPQALQMQQARENTGDNADRFYMEMCVSDIMKKIANLIVKKQSSKIQIRMFAHEIEELARQFPDVDIDNVFDQKTGKLTIDKKMTGNTLYDYEIVSGSTYMVDQQKQLQNMNAYLQFYVGNIQAVDQKLAQEKRRIDFAELNKRIMVNGGIQDWDKIIVEIPEEELNDQVLDEHQAQMQQFLQSMGVNSIPPEGQGTPMDTQQGLPVQQFNGQQEQAGIAPQQPLS